MAKYQPRSIKIRLSIYVRILSILFLYAILPTALVYGETTDSETQNNSYCAQAADHDLRLGDEGSAVYALQKILNASVETRLAGSGIGSPGEESGYFGRMTLNAVRRFQEIYAEDILLPYHLESGTGFVGSSTRAKLSTFCSTNGDIVIHAPNTPGPALPDIHTIASSLKRFSVGAIILAIFFVWGFNFIFWGTISLVRALIELLTQQLPSTKKGRRVKNTVQPRDVAALIPAHNEELVIADTLAALTKIINRKNIYVVSDGSQDKTVEIVRAHGVHVLELNPGKGKAGALETVIEYFHIQKRYKAIVLVDADTRLKSDYLKKALPLFNDPKVVAVAGYAQTMWHPKTLTWKQKLFILHRDRVYFLFQRIVKFGQTWKYANVAHIVPGFASLYRTSILDKVTMNPLGVVIEDFNMTFEVHHKHLGKIAHHPNVVAYTQDPDNLSDYYRQIKRWHLGFWQTIRLHGVWPSMFWFFMSITLIESVIGSVVFMVTPLILIAYLVFSSHLISWEPLLHMRLEYLLISFLVVWLFDYVLSIITAIVQRRIEYIFFGPFFILIRFVDAVAFLFAIPRAFLTQSDGRWVSPSRRSIEQK